MPIISFSCATTPNALEGFHARSSSPRCAPRTSPRLRSSAYPLYRQPPLVEPFSRVTPCPNSELLCEQTISLSQNLLLAETDEMDDIANAVLKVRENIDALA